MRSGSLWIDCAWRSEIPNFWQMPEGMQWEGALTSRISEKSASVPYVDRFSVFLSSQVPDNMRRELSNVCRACFSGEGVVRHGKLVAKYRNQFNAELNPSEVPPNDNPISLCFSTNLPCSLCRWGLSGKAHWVVSKF